MKVPLSWLKEYISTSLSKEELANRLTMLGLEVESIEAKNITFSNILVGQVLSTTKHPNADSLTLAYVTDGKNQHEVVCGDPKCRPGMKTALALEGAVLEDEAGNPFKIKKTQIRGVESNGMLCSLKELKLGEENSGILDLPPEVEVGIDLATLYNEVIFDIGLTPNLNYCSSIAGVARELSTVIGERYYLPKIEVYEDGQEINNLISVKIEDEVNCPRYTCRVIERVKVGPTPFWMKNRLEQCGVRSVNNIVDITNYVLLEMGHPLHAFDLDKIEGSEIVVRAAKSGESLLTLDGKQRTLAQDNLVICDSKKPLALAGVMGGAESEVTDQTINILLESAYFSPSSIRKTSKSHGLQSDASKKFERGTDPNGLIKALDRATQLIQQIAGGTVATGIIDVEIKQFPENKIECRLSRVSQVLGIHLSRNEIETIFQHLSFPYVWKDQETMVVTVPTYRVDIFGEIDLIEEIVRNYGYDNISKDSSAVKGKSNVPHAPIFLFERLMRSRLISEGLQEFLTCDLISPQQASLLDGMPMEAESLIKILNPTSIEQSILRSSLLPGLLQVVKYNFDHQNSSLSGFEIGRIHFKEGEQYKEQSTMGIILTGLSSPHDWDRKPKEVTFFDLKGIVENLFQAIGIDNYQFKESSFPVYHTGRQASLDIGASKVGYLGEIHPAILRTIDLPQRVYYAEFNLHALMHLEKKAQLMNPLPIYPGSERDWTITLKEEIPIQDVFNVLRAIPSSLLAEVSLLDIYRSERIGKERKNVTFHFVYRDLQKTVSQEEVDKEHARVTQEALELLGKNAI